MTPHLPGIGASPPERSDGARSIDAEAWARLCAQVLAEPQGDKLSLEKRLKQEILQMRSLAQQVQAESGHFVCEGAHGRGVAEQKEATLYHPVSHKPIRWVPFKSHLYAVHAALCWAVLGLSTDHW
jgi:hypothetical protein